MSAEDIREQFEKALSLGAGVEKRLILEELAREDPENEDVQAAQVELGCMYHDGKGSAPYNPDRALQLFENPAAHNHSVALLRTALIQFERGKPEAIITFVRTWITGGQGSETAVMKLEELRKRGISNTDFMKVIDNFIGQGTQLLENRIREGDGSGSAHLAKALYYIYELGGKDRENLRRAYQCLQTSLERGNLLARTYLGRTAFSHMDVSGASARFVDADRDYTPTPVVPVRQEPLYPGSYPFEAGQEETGSPWEATEPVAEPTMSIRDLPAYLYSGGTSYGRVNNFGWGAEYVSDSDSNDRITITTIYSSTGSEVDTNAGHFYF